MDSIDHQRWLSDVGRKFPALREWIRGITPEADYNALLDAWENVMADLPFEACLTVNRLMLGGELDGPGEWPAQWQTLPARMRRHVKTLRDQEAGHLPLSGPQQIEHERTLLARTLRKNGAPPEAIDTELRTKGFEGIVVPSRDLQPLT